MSAEERVPPQPPLLLRPREEAEQQPQQDDEWEHESGEEGSGQGSEEEWAQASGEEVWWAEQPGDNWTEGWYAAKVVALSPLDNPTSLRLHYADGDKRWYDNHDEVKRKGNLKWHWLDLEWIPDDDRAEGGSRAPVR
ncbi:hypothetical protein T492DRAFT_842657 [Pavlovales sp. CCMP2436]|nr:hypothetical protein T492DRAFT_842657 [Pavlovales sp. CCMP2436]